MMKRPPVTPIFPGNNGSTVPDNLPIRKTYSREHILNSGGYSDALLGVQPSPHSIFYRNQPLQFGCVDIAHHIETCPICSRLYDTDKTLYVLAIIGLLILCFLMVKRIIKL